jgi:hypothetical protein
VNVPEVDVVVLVADAPLIEIVTGWLAGNPLPVSVIVDPAGPLVGLAVSTPVPVPVPTVTVVVALRPAASVAVIVAGPVAPGLASTSVVVKLPLASDVVVAVV